MYRPRSTYCKSSCRRVLPGVLPGYDAGGASWSCRHRCWWRAAAAAEVFGLVGMVLVLVVGSACRPVGGVRCGCAGGVVPGDGVPCTCACVVATTTALPPLRWWTSTSCVVMVGMRRTGGPVPAASVGMVGADVVLRVLLLRGPPVLLLRGRTEPARVAALTTELSCASMSLLSFSRAASSMNVER